MTPHDWAAEHLLDYVAGQLDDADTARFEQHLAECAECRADVDRLRDELGWLPMGVGPVAPSAGFTARVVRAATGDLAVRRSRPVVAWALAATTVLAAGIAWQRQHVVTVLRKQIADSTLALALARTMAASATDTLSVLRHATHVAYSSLADAKGSGGVVLLDDPTTHRWYVVAYGLPPLPAGQWYQFWFVGSDGMAMGKALAPTPSGMARFATDMPPSPPGRILGAEITVESTTAPVNQPGTRIATLTL